MPVQTARPALDVEAIRRDFPALGLEVYGKPLVYLDNAATSQKPSAVIEAESRFYREQCANVHRGVHKLSAQATVAFEEARRRVQQRLNAASLNEIVFVRGTTEAVNLVAWSFARPRLGPGDEVLITEMEHHSNIVPWQLVCAETGAKLVVTPIDDRGQVIMEEFERLLGERTKMVAVGHISNALGSINPVRRMVELAHALEVPVLVDGAQGMPHLRVDVQALDCDFYAFSGHKAFAPTGIGALYGKARHLEAMPPYQGGGEMIRSVTFEGTVYAEPPARFEAGTPNIAGAIGLGAAMEYLETLDFDQVGEYERRLLDYATAAVEDVPGIRLIGTAEEKIGVLSFVIEGAHAHDVGTVLDREGIAVRTGQHCAQPVMDRFGVPATTRASFAFYNTTEEADLLAAGLGKVRKLLGL